MSDVGRHDGIKSKLASLLLAGFFVLLPVHNAYSVASLNLATTFDPAGSARDADPYMDSGGTWNQDTLTEVTNSTGDGFTLTVENTAAGLPVDDSAFDLAITLDVPTGFRLPSSPFAVTVSEAPAAPACAALAGITATQPGGVGTTVTINIPADTDILPGCSYTFDLGLTTTDAAPFVNDGTYSVDYDVIYNEIDNDVLSQQTVATSQNVEVRTGSVSILKTAVTALAGDGDPVQFTVSIRGSGSGGIFDVELTDVLSADLTGLVITAPPAPPGAPGPGANQYTFDYIAPGEQVDVTIDATVSVDPFAASCPDLRNDASVVERTGTTGTFFDVVPFDLQNPFLNYTAQTINVPFGGGGIDITVPVQNTGAGVAKNISLSVANLSAYTIVVDNISSPNWSYAGGGVFNYAGTLSAGASEDLVFNVSASSCPPPANQNLNWVPSYQNACGTTFSPPLGFSNISVSNIPDVDITKTASAGALFLDDPGSYTLTIGGNNTVSLPDDGAPTNLDFEVTDTLPGAIRDAVINVIPPTTEVLVNGAPYTAGTNIPNLGPTTITWRGDRDDLSPLPALQIDFIAGNPGVCPLGQNVGNTATIDYAACSINNSDAAGFILNESPEATSSLVIGGDGNFETGNPDTNGVADNENREGEHIPFTLNYSFPNGFAGTWAGSSFTADLRSSIAGGAPLILTDNGNSVHVTITDVTGPTVICDADLQPGDFTGGDGTGPLVITDFGALAAPCDALPVSMANHDMVITYTATSPEGTLDGNGDPVNANNVGAYIENTALSVASGPLNCLGNTDIVQATNINLQRAVLDLTANINGGAPLSVCEVVPVTLDVQGPAADTTADNVLLQFNDSNFEFVDAAGNPGNAAADITYGGSLAPLTVNGVQAGNDVFMEVIPVNDDVTADGSATFNVRLRDTMVPGTLSARLDYDSNHTSPDGTATDSDRDYNVTINPSPVVLSGNLEMEFFPPDLILQDSTTYDFRVQIANTGTGDAVNAQYRMTLPAGMRFDGADVVPVTPGPYDFSGQTIVWDLGDLAAGAAVDINIDTSIDQTTCFQGVGEDISSENEWGCGSPIINSEINPGLILAANQLTVSHDINNSFCELCGEGEVRLRVTNTGSVLLTNVAVTEDLDLSGLTYVANSTRYSVDGGPLIDPVPEPVVSGANGQLIDWTPTQIPELAELYSAFSAGPGQPQQIEIRFRVRVNNAIPLIDEDLVTTNRNITASAQYGLFCDRLAASPVRIDAAPQTVELPLNQPAPVVTKQARNVDANQPATAYADTVFGGTADDVIWRVNVENNSGTRLADLEDMIISDTIGGNFDIDFICPDESEADDAANGLPNNCVAAPGIDPVTVVTDHFVDGLFGEQPDDNVDVAAGSNEFIYFVGKIENLCTNHTNTTDIEWGCEVDAPDGGITVPGTNNGFPPFYDLDDDAFLSTEVDPAGVLISQTVTGANPAQDLGSKGIVTITIQNNSGGTIRNMTLGGLLPADRIELPAGYALDQSLLTVNVAPAFGVYTGMVDTITLTNPQADDEDNINPAFSLTSSGGVAPQDNILRHGDVMTVTFGIIKVADFDIVADPVVRDEDVGTATDPVVTSPLNNRITVTFENTCGTAFPTVINNLTPITVNPEDLDIDINIADPDLVYVLSNPTDTLDLTVRVRNRGGHDAQDHFILVTVGSGLQLVGAGIPGACTDIGNPPPPRAVWIPTLPPGATLYRCDAGVTLAPGAIRDYLFTVQKQGAGSDLTFRADVVGEITQSDGAPLTFPPPDTGVITNTANNYSLDSIRARIIGFNVSKTVVDCREQAPLPALSQSADVQIGEDCTYRLSVGWFGFASPGFGQITISDMSIIDTIPSGQGFISETYTPSGSATGVSELTAPTLTTTPAAVVAPNEVTQAQWDFNSGGAGITDDVNIDIDFVTRTRNDALDVSAAPNNHANPRTDTADVSFQVDFDGPGGDPPVLFDNTSTNYPPIADRRVTVTVAEPNLTISKQVCNESDAGNNPGVACLTFADAVAGDVNDIFSYRIRITNTSPVGGTASKPAFDVVVSDTLDLFSEILDPATDTIDNDSDGNTDGADGGGEGTVGGTAPTAAPPRTITFDASTTAALAQIDPGVTVDLYYRVDPDDNAAPGQVLTNTVTVDYDSLAGASGAQDAPQLPTSDPAGARAYQLTDTADVNLLVPTTNTDSKAILETSLTALGDTALCTPDTGNTFCTGIGAGPANIQNVSIGEEVRFRMEVGLPAATYNNLTIVDDLPPGLDCIEVDPIVLDGDFTPDSATVPAVVNECSTNRLEIDFGSRVVTALPTKPLIITFIARVENIAALTDGATITNVSGGGRLVQLTYDDAGGNPQMVPLGPATLTIAEPDISLNKTYAVASADADDVVTVTVTATNTGSAPAYNLRVLDDLAGVANLTFLGNIGGTDPPDVTDTATLGANSPIFSWNAGNPIYPIDPGNSVSFTFEILVDSDVQPLEVLDNTIEAAWTSLPNNSTALNSGGSIGADGSATGMRNGAIPNAGNALNNYEETFTTNALTVPILSASKTDLNPADVPTIGVRKNFQVEILLPEGETRNLRVSDNLAVIGPGYVLENNATYDVTYTFQGISTINGAAPAEGAFVAVPADGATGTVVWNIGDVVTDREDDSTVNLVTPRIQINYFARIDNNLTTDAGDVMANLARIFFTHGETGLDNSFAAFAGPETVLEPQLTATKTFANVTPGKLPTDLPDGGDTIEYSIRIDNIGANTSTAFDVNIVDTLPPELQLDIGFVATAERGVFPALAPVAGFNPVPSGAPGGPLNWGRDNADLSLSIPSGETLVLTYRVVLQNNVIPNIPLNNSVLVDWTSLSGVDADERTGAGCPVIAAPDDYCFGPVFAAMSVTNVNNITKTRLSDTEDGIIAGENNVRVGDLIDYELRFNVIEGTTPNVVLTDDLPEGLDFVGIVSVNGDATDPYSSSGVFTYTDITAATAVETGDPATGPTSITWNLGDITNVADNNVANDEFVIVYRARVLNNDVHPQVNSINLVNSFTVDHDSFTGPVSSVPVTETVELLQPNLSITKVAAPAGGDAIVDENEVVTYTIELTNNGTAPAYDPVVEDTLPVGMRVAGITSMQYQIVSSGAPLAPVPPALLTYNAGTGVATWNFDSGVADQFTILEGGDILRIVYTVQVDADIGTGVMLDNSALVNVYYSFDDEAVPAGAVAADREDYGPTAPVTASLNTPFANPLVKERPLGDTVTTASIGEPFTYTIRIPAVAQTTALYDVVITDDMTALAPDGVTLELVSLTKLSVGGTWTPVNTSGSLNDLVIQDAVAGTGIDIPAGAQIEIGVEVVVTNTPFAPVYDHVAGDRFNNAADYTFNMVDDDEASRIPVSVGSPPANQMTIVEPSSFEFSKTGPANIQFGTAETFTLDALNTGTGPAWDLTITDILPDPTPGGMCDTPPTNFVAQVFEFDGVTPVSGVLTPGADYVTSFTGPPACTLTITMQTTPVAANDRLIVNYDATLDVDNAFNSMLDNFAGVTQWFSADNTPAAVAAGHIRTYTPAVPLSDGTPAVDDEQDVHQVTVQGPQLDITKDVVNVTSGGSGAVADAGDRLEYTLTITNNGSVAADNIVITDEFDRLAPASGFFAPGTFAITPPLPGSVDPTGTNANGGANGAGLFVGSIATLAPAASVTIVYQISLLPVISNGTLVLNQAETVATGFTNLLSDDTTIAGTDNPTETLVGSIPSFDVDKTSQDITGDAAILVQGDTLRYTITVNNVGNDDSVNTLLRDQIPANTTYVANSTTLNAVPVSDPAPGVSRLQAGMLINAPENTTPGRLNSDPSGTTNTATVTFDVTVNADVVNGTIISNQGFVTGEATGGVPAPEEPSDNPDTADIDDDPTQDIVGNLPILDAQKTVTIVVDAPPLNVVDNGDILEYTITVTNTGPIAATATTLEDIIPANSTYVNDSVFVETSTGTQQIFDASLNSTSPLIVRLNSSDLPLHSQAANDGRINPGEQAVVRFQVMAAGAAGAVISNQGTIRSAEQPEEPTDADGNDENGDQPTEVIIGQASTLSLTKEVFVVGGGLSQPGGELEYIMQVTNTGTVNATNIVLDDPLPADVTYVSNSARLNGSTAFNGTAVTEPGAGLQVDYQTAIGALEPGEKFTVAFRVTINSPLAMGTLISNTATVSWTEMLAPVSDTADLEVGGAPGVAVMTGRVWHETERELPPDYTDGTDPGLADWTVNVYLNNTFFASVISDADGIYRIIGLPPSGPAGGDYELRFIPAGGSDTSASMGLALNQDAGHAAVSGTPGEMRLTGITLGAGVNIPEQNQPVIPQGIVYNSVVRTPVAGATLNLLRPNGNPAPAACLPANSNQLSQTTLASGFYRFDIQAAAPGCTISNFIIEVTEPAAGYSAAPSQIIPPGRDSVTQINVPTCSGAGTDDTLTATAACDIQNSAFIPPTSTLVRTDSTVEQQGTTYYLDMIVTASGEVAFNNHIPVDPLLDAAISISKTSALLNVTRSQLVPYTITLNNTLAAPLQDLNVIDNFPAGFKYIAGSARVDGVPTEPLINGLTLTWPDLSINTQDTVTIKMLLVVGSGVGEGEYVNRASVINNRTNGAASGEARATVRVVPDPTFDCSDVIGKVFDDNNLNGYQDEGEPGLSGVRIATATGLLATTDEHGRFHITCAVVPNEDRGSNFIMKLDDRTLPSGYRLTTENPRVQRATRGKMLKFNFGSALHRVVRLDMADAVFEPDTTDIRPQWISRIGLLLEKLREAPSVLRLSYLADLEDEDLVEDRLQEVKDQISERWQNLDCCYRLMIETEVFWRRGGPVELEEPKP